VIPAIGEQYAAHVPQDGADALHAAPRTTNF
jgi:hypothetical protein